MPLSERAEKTTLQQHVAELKAQLPQLHEDNGYFEKMMDERCKEGRDGVRCMHIADFLLAEK